VLRTFWLLIAVLVLVVSRDGELSVLFTRRAAHLNDHAGQISFPGGRAEPGDADAAATALRETAEETGIAADRIEAAVRKVLAQGYRTADIFEAGTNKVGTVEMGDAVVRALSA